ncbi:glycosyltransferase family 22 protein [Fistulina hepatica ATCC 64428]|nr:glycosyltransferase family 22 protein [Fistulina hepatica ATCC 64428]
MDLILDCLLAGVGAFHVVHAPYTKVEESFNLHATHDVLMYGVGPLGLKNYDHFTFPGAVPRSFIGSVALAWISMPIIKLAALFGLLSSKFDLQIIVRLVLSFLNCVGLCLLRRGVSRRFGRTSGLFYFLITVSQFHVPFWMGRTIANMLAFFPVNISTYLLLNRAPSAPRPSVRNVSIAVGLLTSTAIVLRSEVSLLLGSIVLHLLFLGHTSLWRVIKAGLFWGLPSLALTVFVDSYFWDSEFMWPELSGVIFNVVHGKSSEWGTSPFHTYFTNSLPKVLLIGYPLAIVGFVLDARVRSVLAPHWVFILLISCLAHKEWRFIVYVVPVCNVAAARALRAMVSRPRRGFVGRFMFLAAFGAIILNTIATSILTMSSAENYPGGTALALFNRMYNESTTPTPHVHLSNLAAQTGASLFLHEHAPPFYLSPVERQRTWIYNKTEGVTLDDLARDGSITHAIAEESGTSWNIVASVPGFDRWTFHKEILLRERHRLLEHPWDVLTMETSDKLWILEKV